MFLSKKCIHVYATDTIFHLVENLSMSMLYFCALCLMFTTDTKNKTNGTYQFTLQLKHLKFIFFFYFSLRPTQTHNNLLKFRNSALSPVSKTYIKQKKPNIGISKAYTLQSKYEKEIYSFESNQKPLTMRLSVCNMQKSQYRLV